MKNLVILQSHIQELIKSAKLGVIWSDDDCWYDPTMRTVKLNKVIDAASYITALQILAHPILGEHHTKNYSDCCVSGEKILQFVTENNKLLAAGEMEA